MLETGDAAPKFKLAGIDAEGTEREFTLAEFRGKRVVLYFYPKDNTSGCTRQACDFRDSMARLGAHATLIGVSPDSTASHRKFREKHGLTFPLLSDPERVAASAYGAYGEKKLYGKTTKGIIRSTFIIEPNGKLGRVWRGVKVAGHVDEVLSVLK